MWCVEQTLAVQLLEARDLRGRFAGGGTGGGAGGAAKGSVIEQLVNELLDRKAVAGQLGLLV